MHLNLMIVSCLGLQELPNILGRPMALHTIGNLQSSYQARWTHLEDPISELRVRQHPLHLLCISPTLTPFLSALIPSQMHHLPSQSTSRIIFFPEAVLSSQDDVSSLWLSWTKMSYIILCTFSFWTFLGSPATWTYHGIVLELSWANTCPECTCGKTRVVDLGKKVLLICVCKPEMDKTVAFVCFTSVHYTPESRFQDEKNSENLCFPKTTARALTSNDTSSSLKSTVIENLLEPLLYLKIKVIDYYLRQGFGPTFYLIKYYWRNHIQGHKKQRSCNSTIQVCLPKLISPSGVYWSRAMSWALCSESFSSFTSLVLMWPQKVGSKPWWPKFPEVGSDDF